MKIIPTVVIFGVGYVLGSRAGRERYAEIVAAARKASERLEAYGNGSGRANGGPAVALRRSAR